MSTPMSAVRALDAVPTSVHGSALAAPIVALGRTLFALIFLMAGPSHFSSASIGYAAHAGVPFAGFLVPASGILAAVGGLSVMLGYRARLGAWLLVVFLIPVTVMLHNFWAVSDPAMRAMQMAMFMKNLGLLGGALLITQLGAGPGSLDSRRA